MKVVTVAELAMASPYAALIKELNPTFQVPKRPFKLENVYFHLTLLIVLKAHAIH